ncbi:protein of unknown function [Methylocaldum szegediense]|uniref:Uncharacterized protein n=1 Tax=Methylocaldum szegediense TaxID=73780 RepID=A0ABN8X6M2_9GAMM|nr:protein of unknown function [Methylocaldum szegediense]
MPKRIGATRELEFRKASRNLNAEAAHQKILPNGRNFFVQRNSNLGSGTSTTYSDLSCN